MVLVGWTMIMVANLSLIRLMEFITMNSECDERVVVFTEGVLSLAMAALLVYSKLNAGYQWSHLAGIWVGEFVLLMFVLLRKTKLWM
jgi:branched-subunit amino acid transport protein AzlD